MPCALCQKEKALCSSHIIPEFLFKPLYDEKHRALSLRSGVVGPRQIQQGLREDLLCQECEGHLSRLETYFANVWYNPPKLPRTLDGPVVTVPGLDYTQFKLFHLSILWRAGVSSLPAFQSTQLGPHEAILRRMLLDLDPGPVRSYPIFGAVLTGPKSKDLCAPSIMSPIRHRIEGLNLYVLAFGSCTWQYYISSHRRTSVDEFALTEAGDMVLVVADMTEFSPIDSFMRAKVREHKAALRR